MPNLPARVAHLEQEMTHQATMIADIRGMVTDVRSDVRALRERMERCFEQVDRRFEQVDQRFTWIVGIQVAILVAFVGSLFQALFR